MMKNGHPWAELRVRARLKIMRELRPFVFLCHASTDRNNPDVDTCINAHVGVSLCPHWAQSENKFIFKVYMLKNKHDMI